MYSGTGFADLVTVQYLSHIVGSFVVVDLIRQEVVLGEVRMGCFRLLVRNQRDFAIQLLESSKGFLEGCEALSRDGVSFWPARAS